MDVTRRYYVGPSVLVEGQQSHVCMGFPREARRKEAANSEETRKYTGEDWLVGGICLRGRGPWFLGKTKGSSHTRNGQRVQTGLRLLSFSEYSSYTFKFFMIMIIAKCYFLGHYFPLHAGSQWAAGRHWCGPWSGSVSGWAWPDYHHYKIIIKCNTIILYVPVDTLEPYLSSF